MLKKLPILLVLLAIPLVHWAQTGCNAFIDCPDNDTVQVDTSCTASVNYNLPGIGGDCYGSVLITEVSPNTPDFVEVQNLSTGPADYTGWFVAVSNSYSNINTPNTMTWSLGNFTGSQAQFKTDNSGNNYWGNNLFWASGQPGWVILVDNTGQLVDAVFWGWTQAQIQTFSVNINNFQISWNAAMWTGAGVAPSCSGSYSRTGSVDSNSGTDWSCQTSSMGTQNPGFTPPSAGSAPTPQLITGLNSGASFPLGNTINTYFAQDTSNGFIDTCSFQVRVEDNVPPVALCKDVTVQLNSQGLAFMSPMDIDDGSSDNCSISSMALAQDTFSCADFGFNQQTLTIVDGSGNTQSCAAIVTVEDTAGLSQVTVSLGPDQTICNNAPVTLDAGPGFANYSWNTGASTQTITVNGPGIYTVNVSDAAGCSGADNILIVNYNVSPTNAAVIGGPPIICLNQTLDLEAETGFLTYDWSTGSQTNSTQITSGGMITLEVSDSTGCTRIDTVMVTQVNQPGPVVAINPTGNIVYGCDGNDAILDAGAGFASYAWSNGFITQQAQLGIGNYNVTVTDNNGCFDVSDSVEVRDTSATIPTISVQGAQICSSPASGYSWSINTIPLGLNTQCIQPQQNGTFTVTITDQYGCEASESITFVSNDPGFGDLLSVEALPNPFREATELRFSVPYHGLAELSVFGMDGRLVATLYNDEVSPGQTYKVPFQAHDLGAGVYFYRLTTDAGHVASGKLLLTR